VVVHLQPRLHSMWMQLNFDIAAFCSRVPVVILPLFGDGYR
jgi:hypothetical protein